MNNTLISMTNEELMLYYKECQSLAVKQELTLRYTYLLKIIARQMKGVYATFSEADDMINEGIIVLMDAIDKFDPLRNVKFESYASLRIRGAIIDFARKQDLVPRSLRKSMKDIDGAVSELYYKLDRYPTDEEIAAHLNITTQRYYKLLGDSSFCNMLSLNSILTDSFSDVAMTPLGCSVGQASPEDISQKQELSLLIKQGIEGLKENEKLVISLYYIEEVSIKEIAKILSLSESRISQIHSKALLKLRHVLGGYVKE